MDIVISPRSDTPIYTQIAEQVAAQILKGEVAPGTLLPPIRTVARQLEVSVITVKKAWEDLERAGFIYGVVGKGTFVADHPPAGREDRREAMALERLARDLPFYRDLGLDEAQFIELVRRAYRSPPGASATG